MTPTLHTETELIDPTKDKLQFAKDRTESQRTLQHFAKALVDKVKPEFEDLTVQESHPPQQVVIYDCKDGRTVQITNGTKDSNNHHWFITSTYTRSDDFLYSHNYAIRKRYFYPDSASAENRTVVQTVIELDSEGNVIAVKNGGYHKTLTQKQVLNPPKVHLHVLHSNYNRAVLVRNVYKAIGETKPHTARY